MDKNNFIENIRLLSIDFSQLKQTKGTLVEFENLTFDSCTLNISDESQEISIHGGIRKLKEELND